MNSTKQHLLLADDDSDDCMFFREVLEDLSSASYTLSVVKDGNQLMQHLSAEENTLPDVLFLDLNMPLKTGLECLAEIKANKSTRNVPVVIFSTSLDKTVVDTLYENGAHYYIRKPAAYSHLKDAIHAVLKTMAGGGSQQPLKENFVLYS